MNVTIDTAIYGIVGYPVTHSLSPLIYNSAFREMSIDAIYVPFSMKSILGLKKALKKFNIQGISVTIPHKVRIMSTLDKIDAMSFKIGSVNTVVQSGKEGFEGYNTDSFGAMEAIRSHNYNVEGSKVLLIGTGGSARAIAISLLEYAVDEICILSRNKSKGRDFARYLKLYKTKTQINYMTFNKEPSLKPEKKSLRSPEQTEKYDLIINATPLGMKHSEYSNDTPLSGEYLFQHQTLFDIVYTPHMTPLLLLGQQKKLNLIYGYHMLLHQALHQWRIFMKTEPPKEFIQQILKKELKY